MGHKEITYAIENVSDGRSAKDALDGRAFATGTYQGALTAGASTNILIENPADSGVAVMPFYSAASDGEITFRKLDSVTVDAAGTTTTVHNRRLGIGANTQEATVQTDATFSGGNEWNTKVSGSGKASPANTVALLTPDVILEPGDNMVFVATNRSADASAVTLDIPFFEIPVAEVAEL